jgi:hypothetical protein
MDNHFYWSFFAKKSGPLSVKIKSLCNLNRNTNGSETPEQTDRQTNRQWETFSISFQDYLRIRLKSPLTTFLGPVSHRCPPPRLIIAAQFFWNKKLFSLFFNHWICTKYGHIKLELFQPKKIKNIFGYMKKEDTFLLLQIK